MLYFPINRKVKKWLVSVQVPVLIFLTMQFAIPNHFSLILMSMKGLKKVGQKLLKLESGNETLTDGRTLKWFGGVGYKKECSTQTA